MTSASADLERLLEAVVEMRAAQKLEWAALPRNFDIWKRAREKRSIATVEQHVDDLVAELQRAYGSSL